MLLEERGCGQALCGTREAANLPHPQSGSGAGDLYPSYNLPFAVTSVKAFAGTTESCPQHVPDVGVPRLQTLKQNRGVKSQPAPGQPNGSIPERERGDGGLGSTAQLCHSSGAGTGEGHS